MTVNKDLIPSGASLAGPRARGNKYRKFVENNAERRLGIGPNQPAYLVASNVTKDGETYIDTYDDVLDVVMRKDGQTRIYLGKRINGHSVIVVLASKGRKSVQPVTAWQNTTEHYLKKYGKITVCRRKKNT